MTQEKYHWHRQTIAETFEGISKGKGGSPWVPIGDFLDDWRRSDVEDRLELVNMGIASAGDDPELLRWAAFCAGMVEWLCWQDHLAFPEWTSNSAYHLPQPWFLYPGDLLRAWQLASTPTPFKMRNIFTGDQVLSRV
jgi:hypothetical protein